MPKRGVGGGGDWIPTQDCTSLRAGATNHLEFLCLTLVDGLRRRLAVYAGKGDHGLQRQPSAGYARAEELRVISYRGTAARKLADLRGVGVVRDHGRPPLVEGKSKKNEHNNRSYASKMQHGPWANR